MHCSVTGSHHDALESYQKAVALSPSRLIHRVELGRTLHRLGNKEQARLELEVSPASAHALAQLSSFCMPIFTLVLLSIVFMFETLCQSC